MNSPVAEPRSYQSSDLSRHSSRVFAAAEEAPVTVTRRDGSALILMSEKEASARDQLLQLAAQVISAATDEEGSLAQRMAERLPWMEALTDDDREQCAKDLVRASRASFSTGQAHAAITELTAWRETATAIAAGLQGVDVGWTDERIIVERP